MSTNKYRFMLDDDDEDIMIRATVLTLLGTAEKYAQILLDTHEYSQIIGRTNYQRIPPKESCTSSRLGK